MQPILDAHADVLNHQLSAGENGLPRQHEYARANGAAPLLMNSQFDLLRASVDVQRHPANGDVCESFRPGECAYGRVFQFALPYISSFAKKFH